MELFTLTPKEKTKEDYVRDIATRIVNINAEVKDFLIRKVAEAFYLIQHPNRLSEHAMVGEIKESPFNVTSQDVLDFLEANGISTLALFKTSGALQDILVAIVAEYQRLISKPFSFDTGKIIMPEVEEVVPEPIEVLPEEEIIN